MAIPAFLQKILAQKKLLLGSALNTLVMVVLAFFLLQPLRPPEWMGKLPVAVSMAVAMVSELLSPDGEEATIVRYTSFFKKLLLKFDKKPSKEDFLFVNIAYDKLMVPKLDSNGFIIGKEAITDRYKLGRFLEILAKKPDNQRFIICDVFFEAPAPPDACHNDTLLPDRRLDNALAKLPNILIPYHYSADSKAMQYPIFNAPNALANYLTVDGQFFKYEYVTFDTAKSLPLRMYEYLHGQEVSHSYRLNWLGNRPMLNNFILDFPIRQYDLFVATERYKTDNLENMLSGFMSEEEILEYCKNRIIVIGDFEVADRHETVYGSMGGTLILLNAYLALASGNVFLDWKFLLYLFIAYFCTSYYLFWGTLSKQQAFSSNWKKFSWQLLSNVLLLVFISVCSYAFFNVHLSILYLAMYLEAVKWLVSRVVPKVGTSL